MYSHRGTFNIVSQVTAAAAVLAAAVYTQQNLLFILLSAFQTHTSCSLNLKIPNRFQHCPPIGYISQNCKDLQKTLANKNARLCIYGKHNILAMFPQGSGRRRGGVGGKQYQKVAWGYSYKKMGKDWGIVLRKAIDSVVRMCYFSSENKINDSLGVQFAERCFTDPYHLNWIIPA